MTKNRSETQSDIRIQTATRFLEDKCSHLNTWKYKMIYHYTMRVIDEKKLINQYVSNKC